MCYGMFAPGARLVAYALGSHFSADQIVFADRLAAAATPNQMAPNTALNFILFGGALLLLREPRLAAGTGIDLSTAPTQ